MNNLQKAQAFDQAAADLIRYDWVQGTNGDETPKGTGPRCAGQAIRTAAFNQIMQTPGQTITVDPRDLYDLTEDIVNRDLRMQYFITRQSWAGLDGLESVANRFIQEHTREGGYLHEAVFGPAGLSSFVAWQDTGGRTKGQVVGVLIDIAHTLRTQTNPMITPATVFETQKAAFATTKPDKLIEEETAAIYSDKILTGYGSGV